LGEFQVMRWDCPFDGPWSDAAESRYREGDFDGLSLTGGADAVPDLEFLRHLPGLRCLRVRARVKDDTSAFLVPSLEELSLVTGSRARIPDAAQLELRDLVMASRPGIEVASRWPALESFRLGTWRGPDVQMLSGARKLVRFHAEGRRQKGGLSGIERCVSIEHLTIVNCSIESITPLRPLSRLSELRLMAAPPTSSHEKIDLSDLTDSRLRKLWISNASELQHIELLLEMPFLRDVRLIGCPLKDADRRMLDLLSTRARVDIL
jgi:hypothetical protein